MNAVKGFCTHGKSNLICGACFSFPKDWSGVIKEVWCMRNDPEYPSDGSGENGPKEY